MITNQPDREEHFAEPEVLMRCLISARMLFNTVRGSFYPDKDFGSQLAALQPPIPAYAQAYAAQALAGLDGVYAVNAEQQGRTLTLTIRVNDEEGRVNYQINEDI